MTKNSYYLQKKGTGKYHYYKVLSATGNKLKQLSDSGAKLFNSRADALKYAIDLKRKWIKIQKQNI